MRPISNNEIKLIKSLNEKKFRDEYGLFCVEGEKMVEEALSSGFKVEKIFHREEIGEKAMSRISRMSSPSPVLALVRQPSVKPYILDEGLYLALDSIRDPGNLGTLLRLADWFGIKAVFASPDTVDIFNPKVVQASMGAIFRVDFHNAGLPALADEVKSLKGRVYGTFLDGKDLYSSQLDCGDGHPSVIVIGNESEGISPSLAGKVTDRLFIPPYPQDEPGSESLNAAVAAAVTIAEFRRRNR